MNETDEYEAMAFQARAYASNDLLTELLEEHIEKKRDAWFVVYDHSGQQIPAVVDHKALSLEVTEGAPWLKPHQRKKAQRLLAEALDADRLATEVAAELMARQEAALQGESQGVSNGHPEVAR